MSSSPPSEKVEVPLILDLGPYLLANYYQSYISHALDVTVCMADQLRSSHNTVHSVTAFTSLETVHLSMVMADVS